MVNLTEYWTEFGGGSPFRRNILFQLGSENFKQKKSQFISSLHNTDVYQCIYYYEDRDINHCRLYAPLYLDIDGDIYNNYLELRKDVIRIVLYFRSLGLSEDDLEIYFSGAKGFHILIQPETLGINPASNLNQIYKAWANYLYNTEGIKSLDLGIYDRKRLIRIPGSINSKTGLRKFYLSYKELRKLSFEELVKLASNPLVALRKPNKEIKINNKACMNFALKTYNFYNKHKEKPVRREIILPKNKQEFLPCTSLILSSPISEGSRNNTLAILASSILQSGYMLDEALDIIYEWNENNDPPMNRLELEHTVRSAYSMLLDGRHYGCTAMQELGFCNNKDCKLKEKDNR